jgi:site-specific DNA recombinase
VRRTPINSAPKNATVIYARYSSSGQREESITAQIRACEEYAIREGLNIVGHYKDEARTGTNADREQLQQLLTDSGTGKFSKVLVHKVDRLFRDVGGLFGLKQMLERNGVSLDSATENIDDTPNGGLMLGIMGSCAEYYSKNLSNEIKKGQRETALQAKHVGGSAPLGYDVDLATRCYVINEYEAVIVKAIFEMYADGQGYSAILRYLNSMGYRTKRGSLFGKNSLNNILTNEKYTGRYIYNKRIDVKDFNGRRNVYLRPREEWITIEDGLPAIVDKETFRKVEAQMAHNCVRGGRFKAKTLYLLSGLIRCGECGSSMQGNTRADGRGRSVYSSYDCGKGHNKKSCSNRGIRREQVENYVLSTLYDRILSEASIKDLTERLNVYNREMAERGNQETGLARKQLDEVHVKVDRLIRLIVDGVVASDTVSNELRWLEESKVYLERQIEEVEVNKKIAILSEDITADLLYKSREVVRTRDMAECRNLISLFIDSVLVYSDRVDVTFKVNVPGAQSGDLIPLISTETKGSIMQQAG